MIINVKKLKLFGYHGILNKEKEEGQEFIIDINLEITSKDFKDSIDNTVDYVKVIGKVKDVFNLKRYNLLESLVSDIAKSILKDRNIKYVEISISKPNAPLTADFDSVGVIERIYNG